MKYFYIAVLAGFILLRAVAQINQNPPVTLTPEEKYIQAWLGNLPGDRVLDMDFSVSGRARFDYGINFSDDYERNMTQGFLTTIESSLDIGFSFYPESFTNLNPNRRYRGIYAEILLSEFGVIISNTTGIDFWDNYRIYDNYGNPYLPDQIDDSGVIDTNEEEGQESYYQNTMLYTGLRVMEPSVRAVLHLSPHFYFQIANKPELDFNLSRTLEMEGEWAGVETENSGGISLVLEYPLMTMAASMVSQHYYDFFYPDESPYASFRQDDEFAYSLEMEYFIGEYLRYNMYLTYINYYSRDNRDSFYFLTYREGSTVENLVAGGLALTYSPLELINMGFSGDIAYLIDGQFNMGEDIESLDLVNINGIIYDVRIDLPLFYSTTGALIFSAGTYNYGFRDRLFSNEEQNKEFPLDLQLSYFDQRENWELNLFVLAANCLNSSLEYEDVFFRDFQNLQAGLEGSVTFRSPGGLEFTPGLQLSYSMGRIAQDGYSWEGTIRNYVANWQDDIIGGEIYLEIGFPQTLITLSYTNGQLFPDQKNIMHSREFRTQDRGILTVTTEIFY